MLDDYEAFMDEYIEFMERYSEADESSVSAMLLDYLSYLSEYAELVEEIEALDTEEMTDADLLYYTEVTLRVSSKLLNMTTGMSED